MPSREDKIARPLSAPTTGEERPAPPRRAAAQFNHALDIGFVKCECRMVPECRHILLTAGKEIIDSYDRAAQTEQPLRQMAAHESGTAGNNAFLFHNSAVFHF